MFKCHNLQVIKLLIRLRLGFSHLSEHKFKHSFQDLLNTLCKYGFEIESTSYFFLHCLIYNNYRSSFLSSNRNIDCKLLENTDSSLTQMLLYGNSSLDINTNSLISNATFDFILFTERFEEALFWRNIKPFYSVCFLKINQ